MSAKEELAACCKQRIEDLEKVRRSQRDTTKCLTALSIVSSVLAAGGAVALTGIPSVGSAIQAADPPRPAVPDNPNTPDDDEATPAYSGAQPGPGIAWAQLSVGIATGLFSAAAAGFATMAAFISPSADDGDALQSDLNKARAAANDLAIVPILAMHDQARATQILRDAAARCALSDPPPPNKDDLAPILGQRATGEPPVAAVTTLEQGPTCLLGIRHYPTNKRWAGEEEDGSLLNLMYTLDPENNHKVTKVCLVEGDKLCTEERRAIDQFLKDFPDAKP
jgi:hypothetical protein